MKERQCWASSGRAGAAALWFVVSGLVPTFRVAVAFGHSKLIFPSLAKPAGSPCAAGEHKISAFKLECSVDKDFKTLASCAVSYGLT